MPVQHLLKQVEIYRSKRESRKLRPDWLDQFIHQIAELFEPITADGRVGFDCQASDDRWNVCMYLGSAEVIGGPADGQSRHTNFQFNLLQLIDMFDAVHSLSWNAYPDSHVPTFEDKPCSCVTIEGEVVSTSLTLQIDSVPPQEAGPGFHEYPDGNRTPV